jgi:mono/diheme cytochrome c family protein
MCACLALRLVPTVGRMRVARLLAGLGASVLATCAVGPALAPEAARPRGAELFAKHCAACHGRDGNADTVIVDLLRPRPTAFAAGLFKLVSTANGLPTEDDLVRTLERGMPGSMMMSWSWMPEADLRELAREVQKLAVRGRAVWIQHLGAVTNSALTSEQATAIAERELQPGPVLEVGPPESVSAGKLEEGRQLWLQHCAGCHGPDGRGLPAGRTGPREDSWLWPRDFTGGYVRGSNSHRDLAMRIRAGMPGAHMPATPMSLAETGALVSYVRSLVPDSAADRHVQSRRTLHVARTGQLPADEDEAAFAQIEATRLPLAPLWWRAAACSEVWLRAARDDTELVLRLEWSDPTRDDRARPDGSRGDGVAIQFALAEDPPLFAMGSADQPVNVWRWQSYDPREMAGLLDLIDPSLHAGLDVPVGAFQPKARAESIELRGLASVRSEAGSGLPLRIAARWHDGRWTATFRRSLRPPGEREVDLAGAGPVLFAIAIWDGSIDQHSGSKAITTWHVLQMR